jgi:toxin-antitoxin system PIN domain toxin
VSNTVDLPDLNVWLALACPDHSHHRQALRYWEQQAAEQVLFCTITALGLVRLVCQPKLMGAAVKTAVEASALLDAFCQQPGVSMASAEQAGWDIFHQLLRSGEVPPLLCTDAYLAALAMANGWRLVSFDRDFERFEGLERLALPGTEA